MKNISILGLGNISIQLCHSLKKKGFNVFGSTDNFDRQKALKKIGIKNNMNTTVKKINYTYSFGTQKKSSLMKNKVDEFIITMDFIFKFFF